MDAHRHFSFPSIQLGRPIGGLLFALYVLARKGSG